MNITNLNVGDVYVPRFDFEPDIFIQVGIGGDCGVFEGDWEAENANDNLMFRVVVNEPDLKRNWRKAGHLPLARSLEKFGNYGDQDFGSDRMFKVNLQNVDDRRPIKKSEYDSLEPLAVWETQHILERIRLRTH